METLIVRAAGSIVLTVRSTCFSTGTSMAGLAPGGGYVDVAGELVWAPPGVAASAVNTNPPARVRVVLLGASSATPGGFNPRARPGGKSAGRCVIRDSGGSRTRARWHWDAPAGSPSSERLSGGPGATTVESKEA